MLIQIVGKPFKGKSVSAGTFPKPMLYLEIDIGGFNSIIYTKGSDGKLVVPDWEEITVLKFVKPSVTPLDFKLNLKGSTPPQHTKESYDLLTKFNDIMKQLLEKETYTLNGKETGPFKTFVIDALSTFFRLWKNSILYANSRTSLILADYFLMEQILYDQFLQDLRTLESRIPYIICINHEDIQQDELTGRIEEFPVGPSRPMGMAFSKSFDEVWRMEVEGGKYTWRTESYGYFAGAGSRFDLPPKITPATFQELKKYLGEGGEKNE